MNFQEQGWSGYYDAGLGMSGLDYVPSAADAGRGSSYWPGDTSGDAKALNYLGFFPDVYLEAHVGTTGSQAGDMGQNAGAWDPAFRQAVSDFQAVTSGLTVDGWIGPNTRRKLGEAVAKKNATESPIAPPFVPGVIDPVSPVPPAVKPQPKQDDGGGFPWLLAALGVAVVGGGAYYLLK